MFSNKKEKSKTLEPSAGQNRINEGTQVKGDITSTGFFRIDGQIEGNVKTPSKVVIGKSGVIIGTLSCENADIEGRVEGVIEVVGTLTLRASAVIDGEVSIGKLAVEPGATMNASCVMQDGKSKTGLNSKQKSIDSESRVIDKQQRKKEATALSKSD